MDPFLHYINADLYTRDDAPGEGDGGAEGAEGDEGGSAPAGAFGVPTEAELAVINERCALAPQVAEALFRWSFEISNNWVDSHGTWMDKSSLDNYRRAANTGRGVPYLRHHDVATDEMGRVFRGDLRNEGSRTPQTPDGAVPLARDLFRPQSNAYRLIETAYTRRDLAGAPDLIARLESGISASNSIGFGVYTPAAPGSMLECDICGIDLFQRAADGWGYACPHLPGVETEIQRGDGDEAVAVAVIATARVRNAVQREASGVYLGSTPGTYTLADRAAVLFQAGQIGEKAARQFEDIHRLVRGAVVGDRRLVIDMGRSRPASGTGSDPRPASTGETEMDTSALLARVREVLAGDADRLAALELTDAAGDPVQALYRVMCGEVDDERRERQAAEAKAEAIKAQVLKRVGAQNGEDVAAALDRVMALAQLGEGARDRLIEGLLVEMTRAGIEYEAESQRAIAERLTPQEIEAQTAMYKRTADARHTPGRVSDPSAAGRNGTPQRRPDPALVS